MSMQVQCEKCGHTMTVASERASTSERQALVLSWYKEAAAAGQHLTRDMLTARGREYVSDPANFAFATSSGKTLTSGIWALRASDALKAKGIISTQRSIVTTVVNDVPVPQGVKVPSLVNVIDTEAPFKADNDDDSEIELAPTAEAQEAAEDAQDVAQAELDKVA